MTPEKRPPWPADSPLSRRQALRAAGLLLGPGMASAQESAAAAAKPVVCLFSKPLGNRLFTQLPDILGTLGIDAVDLTCRGGGHVLPQRVADDLPRAHALLKSAGIAVPMITTEITDASKGNAEAIVKTAAALGIRYAKLGYDRYADLRRIHRTLAEIRPRLRDLAALFRHYGVQAGYHNHSGATVGAAMWDVWHLIQDLPAEAIVSYFDLGHATVEGGDGGWRIGLHLLLPRLAMVAVKDMRWEHDPNRGWRPRWGPLGEGMVRWQEAFMSLKEARFAGPISLHVEYGRYEAPPGSEDDRATLANIRRDWAFLRARLTEAGLQ